MRSIVADCVGLFFETVVGVEILEGDKRAGTAWKNLGRVGRLFRRNC